MAKSEVYSWRLSPELKSALEEAARLKQQSLARFLEDIAEQWLAQNHPRDDDEEIEQRRLHQAATLTFGTLQGNNPDRSELSREELRARLSRKHAS